MRALRSRTVQSDDNCEHTVEETENHVEESATKKGNRKKLKKRVSEENGQESIKLTDEVVKKKKSKRVKKNNTEDKDLVISDQVSEPDTNISSSSLENKKKSENTSDNDQVTEKNVKNRKIKKPKRRLLKEVHDSNSVRLSAPLTNIFNTSTEQQKSENSSENDPVEKKDVKKKKPKKMKKKVQKELNNSESEKEINVNTRNTDSQQTKEDIEKSFLKRGKKPKQLIRNTILCSPNFFTAVTSTVMKSKRPEIKFDDTYIENEKLTNSSKSLRRSKTETDFLVQNCDQFAENESKLNSSSVHSTGTLNRTCKNNSTFNKSKNLERNKSIENRKSNSMIKNNNSVRRETFNKMSKTPLKNMDSVIAISDSPSISNVGKSSCSKSVSLEFLSDEENKTNILEQSSKTLQENRRMSSVTRRGTFNILPKNKYLLPVDNSVITIIDSPDKSVKENTFNKSNTALEQTNGDKKINDSTKKEESSNGLNESLNLSGNKTCLVSSNNSSINCRSTLSKTSESGTEISETLLNNIKYEEDNGLSGIGESILEDEIDISFSPNKTNSIQNNFSVSNNTTIAKNITYDLEISNSSGNWKIHDNNSGTSNNENNENKIRKSKSSNGTDILNNTDMTVKNENVSSPKDKNLRKKWLKFPRHSSDAQSVLNQISSPQLQKKMNATKVIQKIIKTPTDLYKLQKSSIAPSNLSINKSIIKRSPKSIKKSPIKSNKKSVNMLNSSKKSITKRTAMPNFALIHKKAFEKMENLKEYSERKKERAQKLLQNTESKPKSTIKSEQPKTKSSRQLFASNTNNMEHNRFGFKIGNQVNKFTFNSEPKSENNIVIAKPVAKPSVFTRSDVVALANKNKVVANNRDNRRDMLKGVRMNRRFELLMQMRNK